MIITTTVLAVLIAGTPRDFVEVRQEVQAEYDYSPSIGRQAEPEPEAFVPVRYLTPEQRAEPIIVEPEPEIVDPYESEERAEAQPRPDANAFDMSDITRQAQEAAGAFGDYAGQVPSYITSMTGGSATGSTAIPDYGVKEE